MTYLKGVYWDLDGTIANTELEAHLPAFNLAFKDLDLNWSWDKETYINLLKVNGGKNRIYHYSKTVNNPLSKDFIIDIHKKKQYHYLNIVEDGSVSLKCGVRRLIEQFSLNGVRQFIVTSSSRIQVDLLINKLFVGKNPFEFFITSDDVIYPKPNPSPYLKAISLSGINPINSLVFEDSNPGIKSSLDADLPTIFVHSNIPIILDKSLEIKCEINSFGDNDLTPKVIKGPSLKGNYIDFLFLNSYLKDYYH